MKTLAVIRKIMALVNAVAGAIAGAVGVAAEPEECPICMEPGTQLYTIGCNSTVNHRVCMTCEETLRKQSEIKKKSGRYGRYVKCPMCRIEETHINPRSHESWVKDTSELYAMQDRKENSRKMTKIRRDLRERDQRIQLLQEENTELRKIFALLGVVDVAPNLAAVSRAARPTARPAPVAPVAAPAAAPFPGPGPHYCMSGRRQLGTCATKSRTKRICSTIGCDKFVCRSCHTCVTH